MNTQEHIKLFQVDAFTDEPFAGNPAAVCVLHGPAEEAWMQNVAREMNLSETAFIYREDDGAYRLRWFTPAVEVELCGHATLATAHVLWEAGYLWETEEARFQTLSGLLTARRDQEWIELNFPVTRVQEAEPAEGLIEALGVRPVYVGRSKFDYLVEVGSEKEVREARPNYAALRAAPVRGVIVTSRSDGSEFDFVSRFFAPGSGVDEDPVTGSAHCALAPYWSEKLGKRDFVAYQASARGGVLRLRLENDRVLIGGKAVTVLRGELV
jgi:PhzF family phenazine biosynthesis protein